MKRFTITLEITLNRSTVKECIEWIEMFFSFYHPKMQAKVTAATVEEPPAETLLD